MAERRTIVCDRCGSAWRAGMLRNLLRVELTGLGEPLGVPWLDALLRQGGDEPAKLDLCLECQKRIVGALARLAVPDRCACGHAPHVGGNCQHRDEEGVPCDCTAGLDAVEP